jgi:alkylhydroperoxidase family enzyme
VIPMLSVEEAKKRGKEAGVPDQLAGISVFRVLLHNPPAAAAAANLLMMLLTRGKLNVRIRELVILRTGWRTASEYEFCQHVGVARRAGMSDAEILGVRDPDRCAAYGDLDRAVLRMTDELHDHCRITAATRAIIEKNFTPEELVELLLAAGNWRMIANFLNAAEVKLDEGVASWPEGRKP